MAGPGSGVTISGVTIRNGDVGIQAGGRARQCQRCHRARQRPWGHPGRLLFPPTQRQSEFAAPAALRGAIHDHEQRHGWQRLRTVWWRRSPRSRDVTRATIRRSTRSIHSSARCKTGTQEACPVAERRGQGRCSCGHLGGFRRSGSGRARSSAGSAARRPGSAPAGHPMLTGPAERSRETTRR